MNRTSPGIERILVCPTFLKFAPPFSFMNPPGNAKIAGMAHDLHLDGLKYNIVRRPSHVYLKLVKIDILLHRLPRSFS